MEGSQQRDEPHGGRCQDERGQYVDDRQLPDPGHREAQGQEDDPSGRVEVGASVCGAPQDVPQAVTCTRELTGGLIQVTATGPAAEELGAFTNGLYDSLG